MDGTEFFGAEGEDQVATADGLFVGQVTDNKDPKNLGRVKVKFPFRDKDDDSWWARVATEMASKEYGTWFLPEVGDEVLVGFENGQIRYPIVIGSLYTGKKKKPPYNNSNEKNEHRAIKSRSGHLIDLHDKKNKEKVVIKTGKGRKITMKDKGGSESITMEDGKNTVKMDKPGKKISLEAPGGEISLSAKKITLSAKKQVSISAKQKVSISAKAQVNVSSKGKLQMKSSGMGKLQSSGILQVKGSLVQIN